MFAERYSHGVPPGHFRIDDRHAASPDGHQGRPGENKDSHRSAARARARRHSACRGRETGRSRGSRCSSNASRTRSHQEGQEGSRRGRRRSGSACREGKEEVARVPLGARRRPMRLIVGLGNPGIEYAWTPHNLGFLVVDKLAEQASIRVTRPEAKSYVGRGEIAGHQVVLAKPQTMMNLSGLAVRELLGRTECEPSDVIVICDDIALPWGMIRIRERGSAGGHNGLKSVISALGTLEFSSVRLGVQPDELKGDLKEYVLRQIRRDEEDLVAEEVEQGAEAVKMIVAEGTARAMNHFNRRVPPPGEDEAAG